MGLGRVGQAHVVLGQHHEQIRDNAKTLAIRMKEDHVREEVIDTIIHESLHAAIAKSLPDRMNARDIPQGKEEGIVQFLTHEIMKDIRTVKPVPFKGTPDYYVGEARANPKLEEFKRDYRI